MPLERDVNIAVNGPFLVRNRHNVDINLWEAPPSLDNTSIIRLKWINERGLNATSALQ